jgi:glucosamine 6-phosphate synthetase-like amidotransferase/phosphosugar isomerase protein
MMEGSTMTLCIWTLYDFGSFISIQMAILTMITVLYVLFGRNQKKTDLEKEDTEKLDERLDTIKQRLKESLNQNREPSKESNLELTI